MQYSKQTNCVCDCDTVVNILINTADIIKSTLGKRQNNGGSLGAHQYPDDLQVQSIL